MITIFLLMSLLNSLLMIIMIKYFSSNYTWCETDQTVFEIGYYRIIFWILEVDYKKAIW